MAEEIVDPLPAAHVVHPRTPAEIDRTIATGDVRTAFRLCWDVDVFSYGVKGTLVFLLSLGTLVFFIEGVCFSLFISGIAGAIMLEVAVMLALVLWLLVFHVFRPDNPYREMLRRFDLLWSRNTLLSRFMRHVSSVVIMGAASILCVPLLIVGVVMTTILLLDAHQRASSAFVRGTMSVWTIALMCLFPLGGMEGIKQWGHDIAVATHNAAE